MEVKNPLIGNALTGIKLAKDNQAILFELANGTQVKVLVDGDCCSHSWVEHIELPALGFPATVTAVIDQGQVDEKNNDEYECLRYYVTKIVTDKGEIVIDYRNSSNGYYGGSLSWPEDSWYYGGVYGQNISKEEWVECK